MNETKKSSKLERFAHATDIVSKISIIVGVITGVLGIYQTAHSLEDAARSAKMSALPVARGVVQDDGAVRQDMQAFLASYNSDKEKFRNKLAEYPNASSAYYSSDFAALRHVGRHYEEMGALVKSGYVDFDFIYDIVDFPDDFWNVTEPLRDKAKTNWSQNGGLSDFWRNFSYLQCRYETRRVGKAEPRRICE